ncbi:FAD-dependent monooxygenase [Mucilaginibacter auburnensis]|uniref:2-polyprenyl-6-methoxyphenol hydroxylase-like FAD-dependent oxidoreductase n=1 Tax=Mucilaginibacter auburnensis TaxID=1457233 RepID=A0A2H9VSL1_9SPHI|nr:FAD-dependent monooxygenase [Mucilaginibacter auburnensis]PJJ83807.1 2-polyprenyl-6-methoxyphenol hydroxylase-like FAD-dependent oxidoreductase [Mucilaginibacter auburnensis]
MPVIEQHTQVLIVGAGPSGLMMAAQLLRYGVQPVIIDSKQGPTDQSKALAVQARSLEIYRQMGIIDKVLPGGKQAGGVAYTLNGQTLIDLSFADIGSSQTHFPYVFLYQQNKTERLLLDVLTQNCCPVYWDTALKSITQTSSGVTAILTNSDGTETILNSKWVIGADGAHSILRKQLQIPFNGDVYANEFYLADIEIENHNLDADKVSLYLTKNNMAGFFPMPEAKRYRVIGNITPEMNFTGEITLTDVLPNLKSTANAQFEISKTHWFTTYRLHHRMAERFRQERCFLIGDAAHIHSPVGGQGMNTGLQDAYNLGWKLAGVITGQFNEAILNSYADERMPVAKTLLNTTDKLFKLIISGNWFTATLRKWILPRMVNFAWQKPNFREWFFKRLAQLDISYRDSQINLNLSTARNIKAGDRLPYLKLFDEKKKEQTDLHQWCAKPGFTLMVFGKLQELDLFTLAKWITQNYPGLNLYYLPPSAKNVDVFKAFEISEGRKKAIIVRPDMHIGFINDVVDIDMMSNYLSNILGMKSALS